MRHSYVILLIASITSILTACSGKSTSADNAVTIEADTVVMAMDTATAIEPIEEPVKPTPEEPALDSLASAETAVDFMRNSGHWEEYEQGIIPSILEQNLDYGRRLLRNRHKHFIIVDKESMHVILYDKYGREEKSYLMACSRYYGTKHKRRDNRTPEGFFSASGIYNSTDWLYTNDDGYTSPAKGQFGPRFVRLKTPVTAQVGIHGTSSPNSPGKRVSHGCIRLRNENILELVKYVSVGMPIIVNPSERDQKVNRDEGYDVVKLNIGKEPYVKEKPKKEEDAKQDSAKVATEKSEADTVASPVEKPEEPAHEPDSSSTENN